MRKHKASGVKPLLNQEVKDAEWGLLRALAEDLSPYVDRNDCKVMRQIAAEKDFSAYEALGEYWGLQSINPTHHSSTTRRDAALYLFSSFLSKWVDVSAQDDLIEPTIALFHDYERHCRAYNREGYRELTWSDDQETQHLYKRMLQFIDGVLGTLDMRTIYKYAKFSVGATVKSTRKYGNRFFKYRNVPYEVTERAIPLARAAIAHDARWTARLEEHFSMPFSEIANSQLFQVVPGNVMDFVPKSRKILRIIAKEPSLNMYLQLGVHGYLTHRLKKFGIDITDQSINQRFARLGSIDHSVATFDLKGASGTVTCRIVEKTVSHSWLNMLYALRSDVGVLPDGSIHNYEMFSSMGNGYTFALETLIFSAAVYAVGGKLGVDSHVYGDDIIIPTVLSSRLDKLISACGFIPNMEKSFYHDTHTRESCGHDYLDGSNIRPVFLKVSLKDQNLFQLCTLHNRLWKWWCRLIGDPDRPSVLEKILNLVPQRFHAYGPPLEDDTSSYFAMSRPSGRNTSYGYEHDRIIVVPVPYDITASEAHWNRLNHDLLDCTSEEGSRFDVSLTGDYRIEIKRNASHSYEWPATYELM